MISSNSSSRFKALVGGKPTSARMRETDIARVLGKGGKYTGLYSQACEYGRKLTWRAT
jgi:hypothetical protein